MHVRKNEKKNKKNQHLATEGSFAWKSKKLEFGGILCKESCYSGQGSRMVQWLMLLTHSKEIPGLNLAGVFL